MKKNTVYTLGSLIILLICAFCFVVLPAFEGKSSGRQENAPVFGKYNGKEIKYEQGSEFANFVSQYGQMYQMYGQQLDQSAYYQIFNQAFNSTVMNYAYSEEVKKTGYVVPKSAITREILPYFNDENGNYSSKAYKQTSDDVKLELQKSAQANLTANRFTDDNFGSDSERLNFTALYGLINPQAEKDFVAKMNKNLRGFKIAMFSKSDYPLEEKLKFANQNAAKFNKYDMLIITVEDKSVAETVAKRLANNELTFEDAVSEYSNKNYSDTDGKLTNSYQYQIENCLENKDELSAITGLSNDAVSNVIQTKIGYSIFKNNGSITKPDFDNEATQTIVSNYILNYETSVIEDYYTEKANALIKEAKTSDFATAAANAGAAFGTLEPFPLNYGNVDILATFSAGETSLSNADSNESFLLKAFALKLNEYSEPIVVGDKVVVLKYTTETKAEENDINTDSLANYDEESANNAIMASDKLENDFISVYFNNYMR